MSDPVDIVTAELRRFADRGVFRGFGRRELRGGRFEFRFHWHAPWPHRLLFDPERRTLVLRDLLPDVPYRSRIDREFRAFLAARSGRELPAHRRIDPSRLRLEASNRAGTISVRGSVAEGELRYAANKTVKLLNEIFLGFLAGPYDQYMVEVFGAPEE